MLYILSTIFGISIGLLFKEKISNWVKSFFIVKKNRYDVKFHAYFVFHRSGSKVNEMIKTESITLNVVASNEDNAIELVRDIINDTARLEIESIEICN